MIVRRAVGCISTVVVAIVVALAVPVSQLRTVSTVTTCCCPDPAHCHCPDHKLDTSHQPSIRACHRSQHATAAPELPAFPIPDTVVALAPAAGRALPVPSIPAPHPAPPQTRPDAPS